MKRRKNVTVEEFLRFMCLNYLETPKLEFSAVFFFSAVSHFLICSNQYRYCVIRAWTCYQVWLIFWTDLNCVLCRTRPPSPHSLPTTRRRRRGWRDPGQIGWRPSSRPTRTSSCPTSGRPRRTMRATTPTPPSSSPSRHVRGPPDGPMNKCFRKLCWSTAFVVLIFPSFSDCSL